MPDATKRSWVKSPTKYSHYVFMCGPSSLPHLEILLEFIVRNSLRYPRTMSRVFSSYSVL